MNAAAAPSFQPRDYSADARMADAKSTEQRANEPSMEEILASIRKIISDDSALPKARKLVPAVAEPAAPMLEAAPVAEPEIMLAPAVEHAGPAAAPVDVHPAEPAPVAEASPEPPAVAERVHEMHAAELEEEDDVMDLADHSQQEADFAFLSAPAVPVPPQVPDEPAYRAAAAALPQYAPLPEAAPEVLTSPGTDAAVSASFQSLAQTVMLNNTAMIENMTREMLRPMLKTWLDDNLPVMVERLVRAEIERVARGGR